MYLVFLGLAMLMYSCKDNWELRNEVKDVDNSVDLSQKLAAQANLSVFNGYVKSTGYDQLLANSQNYTVWAPSNTALAALDPAIAADPVKLKDFVGNHIALTTVAVSANANDTLRIKLINNKYATIIGSKFEESNIVGTGSFVKNGVLHTLDLAVPTKQSIWDYMLTSTDAPLQSNFIKNLSINVIDTANATIIGYTNAGNPIFAPNPPMVARNTYWVNVADLRDESKEYTYFMLQDASFTSEAAKISTYYPSVEANTSASYFVAKDLTVRGLYPANKLPDTLLSVNGVKVPINRNAIVKSYRASNGIVHVMSALPFRIVDKVPGFKIEGERPTAFSHTKTVLYRTKADNLGVRYSDIEVYDHRQAEFAIFYTRPNLPVVKYKVYARVISGGPADAQVANFTQRYFFFNAPTFTYNLFYTHLVTPLTYTETYCGEFTPAQFGPLQFRLTSANTTSINQNTVILDYLRFEPVLP